MACGENGLAPEAFERFTYAELCAFLQGCHNRRAREYRDWNEHDAWLAATIINFTHVQPDLPVMPGFLLGRKQRKKAPPRPPVQIFDEAVSRLKGRVARVPSINTFDRARGLSDAK